MKILILMVMVLFFVGCVSAQPLISSVSGNVVDGESVSVSGLEFGVKATATPLVFDDFESGVLNNEIRGQSASHYGQWADVDVENNPVYSGEMLRLNSNQNSKHFMPNGDHSVLRYTTDGFDKVYMDFWIYPSWGTLFGDACQRKTWRIGNFVGSYSCPGPTIVEDDQHPSWSSDKTHVYNIEDCSSSASILASGWNYDTWNHLQLWATWDTTNSGIVKGYLNGDIQRYNYQGNTASAGDGLWNSLILGWYPTNCDGGETTLYYDDVYFDTSWARIEIGDNSDWDLCTHREIQIPTLWSDGSITFTVNQGSFSNTTAYLFVVDENGTASAGYPITFTSVINDTTPPTRSLPSPTTNLSSGTTQTTISLTTDETANCRYSETSGTSYGLMTDIFSVTDSTSHSELISGLTDGQSYNFYVRCNDTSGNFNTDDFLISFGVDSVLSSCGPADTDSDGVVSILEVMNYITEWKAGNVDIVDLMAGIGEWKNGC